MTVPSILDRKNQRKLARVQKKQNKAIYYARKSKPMSTTSLLKVSPQTESSAKRLKQYDEDEEDEEIDSDELGSDVDQPNYSSETDEEADGAEKGKASFRGYNRYGTEDPILAAAEEALDNGLFDSEGNIDEEGFEGLFGSKFDGEDFFDEEGNAMEQSQPDSEQEYSTETETDITQGEKGKIPADFVIRKPKRNDPVFFEPSEQRLKIQKQVKGLLNRLSLGNFESIATSIEGIYKENSRRDVTEVIVDLVLLAITTQASLLDSFVLVFAALIATLGHLVGIEFAAYLLQRIVETLDENNRKPHVSEENEMEITPQKIIINLITFLSFFYDLQIVSNKIVGDIIHEAVMRLNELDVEVLLKIIRNCGAQFRRDDPGSLKSIILSLNERVLLIPEEAQTSRFRFMLEAIMNLKNNKVKAQQQQAELETVRKLLRNMAQQRGISKFEPLRIGLEDIRQADVRGKWWLVGGTWAPDANAKSVHENKTASMPSQQSDIAVLAKEQRMNTDVRKAIFGALVSSDDYLDAFQRLLALRLSGRQERDIIMVILHCCSQEKIYNPFYALVATRFAAFKHNFQVTLRYAFWDWLGQIENAPLRKVSHLASFYAHIVNETALPLNMLKKVDFLHLSDKESLFMQMLLAKVLIETSEEALNSIFRNMLCVKAKRDDQTKSNRQSAFFDENGTELDYKSVTQQDEEIKVLQAGVGLFLNFHLKPKSPKELPFVKNYPLLMNRIDFALTRLL